MIHKVKIAMNRILSMICAFILAFMSFLACYQVFMRYVVGKPSTMSEDILSYSFVWLSLLATALVFGERNHMSLSFFVDKLNVTMKKAAAIFSELLILAVALSIFIFGGIGFMKVGAIQISPTLGITLDWVYSVLPVCGALIGIYSLINIMEIITETENLRTEEEE